MLVRYDPCEQTKTATCLSLETADVGVSRWGNQPREKGIVVGEEDRQGVIYPAALTGARLATKRDPRSPQRSVGSVV